MAVMPHGILSFMKYPDPRSFKEPRMIAGHIVPFLVFLFIHLQLIAQPQIIKEWDRRFGGSGADGLYVVLQTATGGYLLGGDSDSPDGGDKTQDSWGLTGLLDHQNRCKWDQAMGSTLWRRPGGAVFFADRNIRWKLSSFRMVSLWYQWRQDATQLGIL
jgi:hypothetical protein